MAAGRNHGPPLDRSVELAAVLALLLVGASLGAAVVSDAVWLLVPAVAIAAAALGVVVGCREPLTRGVSGSRLGSAGLTVASGAALASVVAGPVLGTWVLVAASLVAAGFFSWTWPLRRLAPTRRVWLSALPGQVSCGERAEQHRLRLFAVVV